MIVVADNGSSDDSVELIRTEFSGQVETIILDRNYGFAEGYNRALDILSSKYSSTIKYYVLLNSDVDVHSGWLAPIARLFESNDNIAVIQPKILSFGRPSHFEYAGAAGGYMDALGYPFCRGRLINDCEQDTGQYDDEREIFWASGAAFAIRREVFHSLGGFEPLFFAHMEEIDLCWRIRRSGYSIAVCPSSVVYHVGAGTLPVWSPQKTYLNFRNNIAMLYKNLTFGRFAAVYFVRLGTDSLRALSYLLTGKWRFGASIFRAHRDFWRTRSKYNRHKDIPMRSAGQIYPGSIVLYYIFRSKNFNNIL